MKDQTKPLLGLATTDQLLDELIARFEITTPVPLAWGCIRYVRTLLTPEELEYSTVGSDR